MISTLRHICFLALFHLFIVNALWAQLSNDTVEFTNATFLNTKVELDLHFIEVVDARETERLGIHNPKKGDARIFVFPDLPEAYLKRSLERVFPKNEASRELILQINQLNLFKETNSGNNLSAIEINLGFFTEDPSGNTVELFQASQTKYWKRNVGEDRMAEELWNLIIDCVRDFQKRDAEGLIVKRAIPLDSLSFRVPNHQFKEIGVFHSYYDFVDNTPEWNPIDFTLKRKTRMGVDFTQATFDSETYNVIQNSWGFTDGKDVYCRMGNKFILIEREGYSYKVYAELSSGIEVSVYSAYYPQYNAAVGAAAMVGGLAGGLIVGIALSSTDYYWHTLDLATGRFVPDKFYELKYSQNKAKISDMATVVFSASPFMKTKEGVKIQMNDSTIGVIKEKEYITLEVNLKDGLNNFCLDENSTQECKDIKLIPGSMNYIEVEGRNGKSLRFNFPESAAVDDIESNIERGKLRNANSGDVFR